MNETHKNLAREAETKLHEAVAACDALAEFERTTVVTQHVAFRQLSADAVAKWRSELDEVEAGKRATDL